MANDSSLQGGAVFAFDLDSQAGVMQLLASVRASEISPEQKNELRDLVFLYTNGGRDQTVRITLEQKILAYHIAPSVSAAKIPVAGNATQSQPQTQHAFGTSRPSPSFTASTQQPAATISTPATAQPAPAPEPQNIPVASVPQPVQQAPVVPSTPVSTVPPSPTEPVPVAMPEPVPQPVPVAQPVPTPAPAPTPAPEPVSQTPQVESVPIVPPIPVSEPVPVATPEPVPQPVPVAQPVPTSAPIVSAPPTTQPVPVPATQTAAYDPNQTLQRIREIKSLVNDKVGNPVNLVDINNEVGREYMGALLDAMKKLNNGTSALSAMKRLEEAYAKVETTLAEHEKMKVAEEVPPEPVLETPPVTPTSSPQPEETKPDLEQVEEIKNEELPPVPEPEDEPMESVPDIESVPTPPRAEFELPVVPRANIAEEDKPEPKQDVKEDEVVETASGWGPATDTVHPDQTNQDGKFTSLAGSKTKLRSPDELKDASSLETSSVSGDPLFTKEVDDGLQQLLSEWSLFKKSGLFGTGPKGREHPLFLKVAGLQIPLLLAGRFEGATQEVKQSITDYMNGWRYEQGIIYMQGETFEHYLRRVIRHILDLQKRKVVR